MGMDDLSFAARAKRSPKPKEIIANLSLARIEDYFEVAPRGALAAVDARWTGRTQLYEHCKRAPGDLTCHSASDGCSRPELLPAVALPRARQQQPSPRGSPHRSCPYLEASKRAPGHGRPLLPGIGRATRLDALRPSPQGGRHHSAARAKFPSRRRASAATSMPRT